MYSWQKFFSHSVDFLPLVAFCAVQKLFLFHMSVLVLFPEQRELIQKVFAGVDVVTISVSLLSFITFKASVS